MPYPPQHREQVRERIIQSAGKLFNHRGFIAVSIDEVMAAAGLTRGSFYSYFQSKGELYFEMIERMVSEARRDTGFITHSRQRAARTLRDHISPRKPGETEPTVLCWRYTAIFPRSTEPSMRRLKRRCD